MSGLFHSWRHPRRCYVICAVARSGSNLLSDGLRDTGRAGRPNHFFLPSSEEHFRPKYGFKADSDFADYVRGVVKKTSTSNEVFAFKLMAWYLPKFLARLRQTGAFGVPDGSDLEMLHAAFPRLRFIRISRRGKLRQAISKVRATQTGVWKVQESETPIADPEFDRALIDRSLAEFKWSEDIWDTFFVRLGIRPFQVEYEDLCRDYEGTLRAVLDFLEISLPRKSQIPPPATVKQSDSLSDEWERRYLAEESAG
ncbi:MAG: Stf0 family sulfotransferase [Chthoniobacterales bacterium]